MNPAATIVVVNFNSGEHLYNCISALKNQTITDFEVIVLDNASRDGSFREAADTFGSDERFSFVGLETNIGFAAANNCGADRARGRWLATLNPDAFAAPDWLEKLLEATKQNPDIVMFGSMQFSEANPTKLDGAGDRYFVGGVPWRDRSPVRANAARIAGDRVYETFAPCAAAALYRLDKFREAGGFDERFFCYVEDVDLGFRLQRQGETCLQVLDACVRHVGGGSGEGERSDFARYHGIRNLIWCFAKNMPSQALILLIPLHVLVVLLMLLVATMQGQFRPVGRGIIDAVRGLGDIRTSSTNDQTKNEDIRGGVPGTIEWSPVGYLCQRFGWA